MDDMLKQADEMTTTINLMQRMYDLMQQMVDDDSSAWSATRMRLQEITEELRDHLADFDDFWRPLRNYLYWEPHCFDIPICWSLRSHIRRGWTVSTRSPIKWRISSKTSINLMRSCRSCSLQFPQMIATMQSTRTMMLTMHSTMSGIFDQMDGVQRQRDSHGEGFRRRP